MNTRIRNLFLLSDSLSNVELYYSAPDNFSKDEVVISGDEAIHILNVMRHKPGDEILITNGEGTIFRSSINQVSKNSIKCEIITSAKSENRFAALTFCIPILKSPDRFEFALEKLAELGITNIIVFNSLRSVSKGIKTERWGKILLSAMKQSLRPYLPELKVYENLTNIFAIDGEKILFEQNSQNLFAEFTPEKQKKYYFIFGPEGGLAPSELSLADKECIFNLSTNRLRTETAVVFAASVINSRL